MTMADCEKCLMTPCGCGWEFRDWDKESLEYLIKGIVKYSKLEKEDLIKMLDS